MIKIFIVKEDELEATHNRDMVASVFYSLLERAGAYPCMAMFCIYMSGRRSDDRKHLCLRTQRQVPGHLHPDDTIIFMTTWEYAQWRYWYAPCEYMTIGGAGPEDVAAYKQAYNMYAYEDYAEDD